MHLEVDLQKKKEVARCRVWAAVSAQRRSLQSALGALALVGSRGERLGRGGWTSPAWNASSLDCSRGWLCDRHLFTNTQPESRQPLVCTEAETWGLTAFRHLLRDTEGRQDHLCWMLDVTSHYHFRCLSPPCTPGPGASMNSTAVVCNLRSSFLPIYYIYLIESRTIFT